MTRRCSHCSHNGHNSRTCPNRGVKLFGVRLTDGSIRKSASMGNLTHYSCGVFHQNGVANYSPVGTPDHPSPGSQPADGYASEDFVAQPSSSSDRKKGVPWTENEHRLFLLGLQKLGKGDWRGISHNYVVSRTPTQVASHAQKHFIRQSKLTRRRRRSSLFDIVVDDFVDAQVQSRDRNSFPVNPEAQNNMKILPVEESESMESAKSNDPDSKHSFPTVYPAYLAPIIPFSAGVISFWPGFHAVEPENIVEKEEMHEVVKPRAVHATITTRINVDEIAGMSNLTLGDCIPSLNLVDGSSRPSAFHANSGSSRRCRHNSIQAI